MKKWQASTFVLTGIVIGMVFNGAARAEDPLKAGVVYAPHDIGWHCYVLDKIMGTGIVRQEADLVEAAEWGNSKKMTGFFNLVAPNTVAGTVLTFPAANSAPMACVKN